MRFLPFGIRTRSTQRHRLNATHNIHPGVIGKSSDNDEREKYSISKKISLLLPFLGKSYLPVKIPTNIFLLSPGKQVLAKIKFKN